MVLNFRSCLNIALASFILHSSHTLSVFNQPKDKLETEIRLILDRHNQYRTCHHAPPLVIDPQLTKDAQSLAIALASEKINLEQARRWRQGNLFITQWNLQLDELFTMSSNSKLSFNPVDKWYNEVKFYFDDRSRTDHFSRIVWKDTKKLGVGIAQNEKGFVYIVCKYDPEGNIPGLYDKNVIIPDEKMIHATDICVFPPMTSPSKKKGKTTSTGLQTSTATVARGSKVASASDFKLTSTYDHLSSTMTYDNVGGAGISTIPTSTATKSDILGSQQMGSVPSTYSSSAGSSQTGLSTSFDLGPVTQPASASTIEPGSTTGSNKYLGSITWHRITPPTSTMIPGTASTIGVSSLPTPASIPDLLIPTPSSPLYPADGTPSPFSTYESSTPSSGLSDIFPTITSQPDSRPEEFLSTSTIAPHISTISTPPVFSPSTTISPEFKDRLCNSSDASGNLTCILPDKPQGTDSQTVTPATNRTTDWLDLPEHEYGNQTGDSLGPFGKTENKAEYLRFTLLFMGLLVASMSAAVSLLAVFAIFKLFVCCRRAHRGNTPQDAPSSPGAQTPSNLVSIIPTTNPRPISPTLSRPGSPVFQRTVMSTKMY